MKRLISIFIVYFIFGTNVSYAGCKWYKWVVSPVECAGESAARGATPELEKSASRIIDEKVKPLIRDVDTVLKQRVEQLGEMSKELLKDADEKAKNRLQQLNEIVNNANLSIEERLEQADKIVSQLIAEADDKAKQRLNQLDGIIKTSLNEMRDIVDEVNNILQRSVSDASSQLDDLRKKFRQDAVYYFDRTEYIIETVDCKVTGTVDQIKIDIERVGEALVRWLPRWLPWYKVPDCYSKIGITKAPQSFEYATIYDLRKCERLNSLKPSDPVNHIKNVYLDLKTLSAKMMCVQRQAGYQAKLHYTWDWLEFGKQYDFWAARAGSSD